MYNMFVITLVPFKSHLYFLLIYHVKNVGQVSPNKLSWPVFLKPWYYVLTVMRCQQIGKTLIHMNQCFAVNMYLNRLMSIWLASKSCLINVTYALVLRVIMLNNNIKFCLCHLCIILSCKTFWTPLAVRCVFVCVVSEKGFCIRGDLCTFDHGVDPVVIDNVLPGQPLPSQQPSLPAAAAPATHSLSGLNNRYVNDLPVYRDLCTKTQKSSFRLLAPLRTQCQPLEEASEALP